MQPTPPPPYVYAPHPPPKSGVPAWVIVMCCVIGGVFMLGIIAAVAIPAFMSGMRKAHQVNEAERNLDAMYKGLKGYVVREGALPNESAPVTPAESCCAGPGHRCAVDPSAWSAPAWRDIDFEVDERSLFQYSYQVDGDSVTMTATADLACDGEPSSYVMTAHVVGGVLQKDGVIRPGRVD